jgi:hypothetical protein
METSDHSILYYACVQIVIIVLKISTGAAYHSVSSYSILVANDYTDKTLAYKVMTVRFNLQLSATNLQTPREGYDIPHGSIVELGSHLAEN